MQSPVPDKRARRRGALPAALLREMRARGLLLPAALGLVVAATLVHGALARTPSVAEDALPTPATPAPAANQVILAPPEADPDLLQTLRPGLEKTPLSYLADYWLQLGAVTRPKLLRLGEAGLPGLVVMRGLVLAPEAAADPYLAARRAAARDAEEGVGPAPDALLGIDSKLGLALLRLPSDEAAIAFSAAPSTDLAPGSLLAAISLAPQGGLRVVPGYLASTHPVPDRDGGDLDAAVALPPDSPLAALVDLDGALVGVALTAPDGQPRFWSYDSVAHAVARLASEEACIGLAVAPLSPEVSERLGVEAGLLIEAIHPRAWGDEPAIHPGDVLLAWDDEAVTTTGAFLERYVATPPGRRVAVRVLRNRQRLSASVTMPGPGCQPMGPPPERLARLGVELEWAEMPPLHRSAAAAAWRVIGVEDAGAGAEAGLEPGDWILAVDGRAFAERTLAPLQACEQRGRAAALSVRRRGRVMMLLVPAAGPDAP